MSLKPTQRSCGFNLSNLAAEFGVRAAGDRLAGRSGDWYPTALLLTNDLPLVLNEREEALTGPAEVRPGPKCRRQHQLLGQ